MRTMNDVSVREAAKWFESALIAETRMERLVSPEAYPDDIAARDFLECLKLFCDAQNSFYHDENGFPSFMRDYDEVYIEKAFQEGIAVSNYSVQDMDAAGLTDREKQVLQLRQTGMGYKDIAAKLGIEIETVRSTLAHCRIKLNHDRGMGFRKEKSVNTSSVTKNP